MNPAAMLRLSLLLPVPLAIILLGTGQAAPFSTGDDDAGKLAGMYRDLEYGFTIRYAPQVRTRFGSSGSSSNFLDDKYPGRLVTVGWVGKLFDIHYTFQEDRLEINRNVDLNQTPDNTGDDTFVENGVRTNHFISIGKLVRVDFWRLFVNLGFGVSFGTIEFRQQSPNGRNETDQRHFWNILYYYEPMVELLTLKDYGFNLSIGYLVFRPILLGNDFAARTHGAGLMVLFVLPL